MTLLSTETDELHGLESRLAEIPSEYESILDEMTEEDKESCNDVLTEEGDAFVPKEVSKKIKELKKDRSPESVALRTLLGEYNTAQFTVGGVISGTQGMNDEMAEIHLGISVGDTGHKSSSGHFRAHFKAVFVAQRFGQIVPDQLKALQGQCGAHMIALCGYNGFHRMAHGIQPGLGGQTVGHGHAVSGVYNGQSGNVVFRRKIEMGIPEKIRPCIGCNVGCYGNTTRTAGITSSNMKTRLDTRAKQ